MSLFTLKEIELDRKSSEKIPGLTIMKTLDRGRKFKEEKDISAEYIYIYDSQIVHTTTFSKVTIKYSSFYRFYIQLT